MNCVMGAAGNYCGQCTPIALIFAERHRNSQFAEMARTGRYIIPTEAWDPRHIKGG